MSLLYKNPIIYDIGLKMLHGRSLRKRYELIAREIGENKRVFEPGCGTCLVFPHLQSGCEYEGWDLNTHFVNYNLKRGRGVFKKDIFDFKDYPPNDVIILCDLLHHVAARHKELIEGALERTEKLIISEASLKIYKYQKRIKPIALFFQTLFDDDGINPVNGMVEWDYDKEKLHALFNKYGFAKVFSVGLNTIAVFDKREQTILNDQKIHDT